MNRADYSDDMDGWDLIRWRGAVKSAIKGKRGQRLLRDMLAALDAMPNKMLIDGMLEYGESVCALGAVGRFRGIDMDGIDASCHAQVAEAFHISEALAREVEYMNDDYYESATPEIRWIRMREWAEEHLHHDVTSHKETR